MQIRSNTLIFKKPKEKKRFNQYTADGPLHDSIFNKILGKGKRMLDFQKSFNIHLGKREKRIAAKHHNFKKTRIECFGLLHLIN